VLCFARNAWFIASQGAVTWIAGVLHNVAGLGLVPRLWATDGTHLFECFQGAGAAAHDMRFKLWDFGAFTTRKQMTRLAVEFSSVDPITTSIYVENETTTQLTPIAAQANTLRFIGAGGVPLRFIGAGSIPINWISGGIQIAWGGQIDFAGNYLSVRVAGTSKPFTLSALAMEIDPFGEWTMGPP
jgi:hypothetical protein